MSSYSSPGFLLVIIVAGVLVTLAEWAWRRLRARRPAVFSQADLAGMTAICSSCMENVTLDHIHVIPWFNETRQDYVTAYRCDKCWLASLAITRQKFLAHFDDPAERSKFVAFCARHKLNQLGSLEDAQLHSAGLGLLDRLQNQELDLRPSLGLPALPRAGSQ